MVKKTPGHLNKQPAFTARSCQEEIWRYFQNEGVGAFVRSQTRLSYLVREAKKRGCQKVLNIGVGAGYLERIAKSEGLKIASLDPDPEAIKSLSERLGTEAKVGYIQQIPFENASFDAVVVSELLEHLDYETMLDGLREVKRVLAPGGYLIGTVPYQEDLASNMVVCPHCGKLFHRWGHLQAFSVEVLREVLAISYEIDRVFARPFPSFSALNWKGKILGLSSLMMWRLGAHGAGSHLVFVARKVPG